jgi:hypothetical protein
MHACSQWCQQYLLTPIVKAAIDTVDTDTSATIAVYAAHLHLVVAGLSSSEGEGGSSPFGTHKNSSNR